MCYSATFAQLHSGFRCMQDLLILNGHFVQRFGVFSDTWWWIYPSVKIESLLSSRHPELCHNTCCVSWRVCCCTNTVLLVYLSSGLHPDLFSFLPSILSQSGHISIFPFSASHLFGASLFISFPLPRAGRWAVMNGSAGHTFFDPVTHRSRGGGAGRGLLQHPQETGWRGLWTTFDISNYPCDISPNEGSHHSEQLTVLQSWAFSSKLYLQMHWQTWSIYSVELNSWILIVFCKANSYIDVE